MPLMTFYWLDGDLTEETFFSAFEEGEGGSGRRSHRKKNADYIGISQTWCFYCGLF